MAMSQSVAVIGAGRMGTALATALFNKGFATTVWNRTPANAEPMSRIGVRIAPSVLDAVVHADVVIVNITNYEANSSIDRSLSLRSPARFLCN
jgi:3-hydroxyisobutyrate dehydrogenase-like beta-hydroxyacid dehydrogenase